MPHRGESRVLSTDEKGKLLKRASAAIEKIIGNKPVSFKAPFNSIDHPLSLAVLDQVGVHTDSSLPCYSTESFINPIRPTPVHHAAESHGMIRCVDTRLNNGGTDR